MNHSVSQPSVNVDFIECDLASLSSITEAAKQVVQKYRSANFPDHSHLFSLQPITCSHLQCWGLHASQEGYSRRLSSYRNPKFQTTQDGLESSFGVNHVGHFHLVKSLLPLLRQSVPSRIVIVSSEGHGHSGVGDSTVYETQSG